MWVGGWGGGGGASLCAFVCHRFCVLHNSSPISPSVCVCVCVCFAMPSWALAFFDFVSFESLWMSKGLDGCGKRIPSRRSSFYASQTPRRDFSAVLLLLSLLFSHLCQEMNCKQTEISSFLVLRVLRQVRCKHARQVGLRRLPP